MKDWCKVEILDWDEQGIYRVRDRQPVVCGQVVDADDWRALLTELRETRRALYNSVEAVCVYYGREDTIETLTSEARTELQAEGKPVWTQDATVDYEGRPQVEQRRNP